MERLDRSTVIVVAIALTVGFAIWQVAGSIAYIATELLVDWWEEGDESFNASFSVGSVDIEYGQLLASVLTLLVVLALAVPLLRRVLLPGGIEHRGTDPLQ
ncbi:MAG: hypothetical protein ACRDNB_12345 [Gaiellaceae bacterium]